MGGGEAAGPDVTKNSRPCTWLRRAVPQSRETNLRKENVIQQENSGPNASSSSSSAAPQTRSADSLATSVAAASNDTSKMSNISMVINLRYGFIQHFIHTVCVTICTAPVNSLDTYSHSIQWERDFVTFDWYCMYISTFKLMWNTSFISPYEACRHFRPQAVVSSLLLLHRKYVEATREFPLIDPDSHKMMLFACLNWIVAPNITSSESKVHTLCLRHRCSLKLCHQAGGRWWKITRAIRILWIMSCPHDYLGLLTFAFRWLKIGLLHITILSVVIKESIA